MQQPISVVSTLVVSLLLLPAIRVTLIGSPRVTRANFEKIRNGMTRKEVDQILGDTVICGEIRITGYTVNYQEADGRGLIPSPIITVVFDAPPEKKDDYVVGKTYHYPSLREWLDDVTEQVHLLLGLHRLR